MSFSAAFNEHSSPLDRDQATLSNYHEIRTNHTHLEWTIDWSAQTFGGRATLAMTSSKDVDEVVLDSSFLDVKRVLADGKEAQWRAGERIGVMGEGLFIDLPHTLKSGGAVDITVEYSTTKDCTAVGWLTPVQTKSGKYPYLYSQSQAIHARSMLPCQDTPAIKSTYSATVKSILPVLMSGLRKSPPSEEVLTPGEEREYVYDQPVAIPSYLIAIASGELVYRPFDKLDGRSWRTGCWAEPGMIEDCFWEFKEDTANFVKTAEDLTSPYEFGVYDILFLPDSFPYGGMENSCLTFATPTIVAGDRSAVDVCAHEISHSWFGNGIGCASWSHFWLNEGWTTYLERLIIRETHSEGERQMSYAIGRRGLQLDLERFEPRFQRLVLPYKEYEDPDEGYSQVAYEKGSNFLLLIERTVGGVDNFIPYMRDYVKTFNGSSITTDQWRSHLFHFFGKVDGGKHIKELGKIDWDEWLHGDGKDLCVDMQYADTLTKPALDLAEKWDKARDDSVLDQFSPKDVGSFSANQKIVFLNKLGEKDPLSAKACHALGEKYALAQAGNAELRLRFYQIVLKTSGDYSEDAAKWVVTKGRMKFCRPTFRLIYDQNPELAKKTFLAHKDFYHPIARKMIARDIGVKVE